MFWESSSCRTCPTVTDRHRTFFTLMVDLTCSIIANMDSWWETRPGNLPALCRPGPNRRGIWLIRDSKARKASLNVFVKGRSLPRCDHYTANLMKMLLISDAECRAKKSTKLTRTFFLDCPALVWLRRKFLLRIIAAPTQIANCSTKKEIQMKIEYKRNEFSNKN